MELIEEGGYGSVYRRTKPNKSKIAVKRMTLTKDCLFFASLKEVNSLKILSHPNIVKFRSLNIPKKNNRGTVGDYSVEVEMDLWDTDLQTFMTKIYTGTKSGLSLCQSLTIFSQLLSGVIYLHDNGIIHLDIKPANILLNNNSTEVCICDFGCSSYYSFDGVANVGTINCRPPENFVYLAKGQLLEDLKRSTGTGNIYSSVTDVFSCGVILLYLLTGRNLLYPDNNYKNIDIPEKHLTQFVKFHTTYIESFLLPIKSSLWNDYAQVREILIKMLALNPKDRPSLKNIITSPIFDQYKSYLNITGMLHFPLYTNVNVDSMNISLFHKELKPVFSYFEETLCSYSIVKTTLDIAIRFFALKKNFDSLDLVSCLRTAFIFYDDDEDLPLNMFNKKYKSKEVDLRCLQILKVLQGYLVIRNPFDKCQNMTQLNNLFKEYLQIKGYFFYKIEDKNKEDKDKNKEDKDNNKENTKDCIPEIWMDIVCKSSVIKNFILDKNNESNLE